MRDFNITGLCVPKMHYMVDISAKLDEITRMIDKGLYFTINRARQYGKTTTFFLLCDRLKDRYLIADLSFEGVGDSPFETDKAFCGMFQKIFTKGLKIANAPSDIIETWNRAVPNSMDELGEIITQICDKTHRQIVLMIDEVDKTSNNQVFLNFLGMLRNKYLQRNKGADYTFQSVLLAGVYDVKNLKRKISGEEILSSRGERIYNSPWNIAADFLVDMSFNPAEIATMLVEYENDYHTGMDITAISNGLYRYTSGYPFLVSKLCKTIDEQLDKNWTAGGVEDAVTALLKEKNTLFDDMFKNIENNKKLYNIIFDVMIRGEEVPFSSDDPAIELGDMFGILKRREDGRTAVANEIFELRIANYLAAGTAQDDSYRTFVNRTDVIIDGVFDMPLCLEKFAGHFYGMYSRDGENFLEKYCRLLFITYLAPLINGNGFYHIETQTRDNRRMDLVVDYGKQQFVVELKLWHGDKKHEDAYRQLWEYLDAKGFNEGYLLTFDFRNPAHQSVRTEVPLKAEWVEFRGKRIFDVVIAKV